MSFLFMKRRNILFLMEKVKRVLGDGTQKFLDYMVELKEKKPDLFYDLLTDYELSSRRTTPIMNERQTI